MTKILLNENIKVRFSDAAHIYVPGQDPEAGHSFIKQFFFV